MMEVYPFSRLELLRTFAQTLSMMLQPRLSAENYTVLQISSSTRLVNNALLNKPTTLLIWSYVKVKKLLYQNAATVLGLHSLRLVRPTNV